MNARDLRRSALRALVAPLHAKHHLAARIAPITANERRLLALRDAHRGKRCVVIGGGPSLASMDLRRLAGELTFGVNGVFHMFDRLGFVPTFYVVEDRLVAEDNWRAIRAIRGTTKIFPEDLRYRLPAAPDTIHVAFDRFYDAVETPGPDFPRFVDPDRWLFYWGGTVTYLALELAWFMGFSRAIVIGIDLSYRVPASAGDNGVITSHEADPNHADPRWFGPGKRWHAPRVDRMVRAFERARDAFAESGRSIVNATAGGALEVYPRLSLDEALDGP